MSGTCNRSDCDITKGLPCEMGHRDEKKCQHYRVDAHLEATAVSINDVTDDGTGVRLPWTGRALGLADVILTASRGATSLVGLVAPFNAGKTGLLTAIYAHLAQTGHTESFDFAGSFSLQAWNQLKDHTKWPSLTGGVFPPHTADTGQRTPGLLHLAFRQNERPIRDILFTDAPGEWFTRWMTNEAADNAAGARWIADNATHFIYVVDRAGLAGEEVGPVRQNTLALARRLGEEQRGRPILVVWAKSDGVCDVEVETPLRARLKDFFGEYISLDLHVYDSACLNLIDLILDKNDQAPRQKLSVERASAFLKYGEVS